MNNLALSSHNQFLIIGAGRLAQHLKTYLTELNLSITLWSRERSLNDLKPLVSNCTHILLAISDKSLNQFYDEHLKGTPAKVIHFSGALDHPQMYACHPLMTFSKECYTLDFYKKIYFAVTGANSLQDVIPDLPNPSFKLKSQDRALYHAWCVLTAAGAQTIWNEAAKKLQHLGVPNEALKPYISAISENFIKQGSGALTGPWARRDISTIDSNIKALGNTASRNLYELLMRGLS